MEQVIRIQDYQDSGTFFDPGAFTARVQDETLSSRKKLTFEAIQTSTSSATASLARVVGVALVSVADVTAGIDDFMSQKLAEELAEVSVRLKDAAKKPDILQQPSSYFPASATTSDLVSFVRNHVRLEYSASLANRLDNLREASIEEAPEQAPISVNSLQSFVSFIAREATLAQPEVVLTYTGNIRAEWHKSRKEHFSVEFLPNGQVRYVVFTRDPNYATRIDRATGLVSAETLMDKVKPFNVLAWAAS